MAGDLSARSIGQDICAGGRLMKRATGEHHARSGTEKGSNFHASG
jgi:hypothetical protein